MNEDFEPDARFAALLAAAAAPGQPHELAGEQALLAEFRRVHPRKPFWRRSLKVVIPSTVLAVTAGSIAFAAGVLQNPFLPPPVPTPSAPPPASVTQSPSPVSVLSPTPTSTSKSAAFSGLCHAYLAKPQAERGKALQSNAFRELVEAAGGPDKVDAFCAAEEKVRPSSNTFSRDGARG